MISKSLLLFFIVSCSLLTPQEDTSPTNRGKGGFSHRCQSKDYLNFASDNYQLNHNFKTFAYKQKKSSFIDTGAAWFLIQMNNRPDLISVNSAVQFLIRYRGKTQYYSFSPQTDNSYSYIQAIDFLLNKFKGKDTLKDIARKINKSYKEPFLVSNSFANKLKQYKDSIVKNPHLKSAFMKGGQVLHQQEPVPILPFSQIINIYNKKKKKTKINKSLTTIINDENKIVKCNKPLIPANISRSDIDYYPFAIYDNRGNAIIAVVTQNTSTLTNWKNTFLFKGQGASTNSAICFQFNKKKRQSILSFAINNRSPEQLMHRFLSNITNLNDIIPSIEQARILELTSPRRIIYEYDRGTKSQYQKLLDQKLPVYSSQSIGTIWTYYFDTRQLDLIQDSRTMSFQSCLNNKESDNNK